MAQFDDVEDVRCDTCGSADVTFVGLVNIPSTTLDNGNIARASMYKCDTGGCGWQGVVLVGVKEAEYVISVEAGYDQLYTVTASSLEEAKEQATEMFLGSVARLTPEVIITGQEIE